MYKKNSVLHVDERGYVKLALGVLREIRWKFRHSAWQFLATDIQ